MTFKVLNLYAGIGGNRKNWHDSYDVTNIEINGELVDNLRINFPNDTTIRYDAMSYLKNHYHEFDFIWASPPCQTHSRLNRINSEKYYRNEYVDPSLMQIIIFLQSNFEGGWIVENVRPYYGEFFNPTVIGRHCFWSNYDITHLDYQPKNHKWFDLSLSEFVDLFGIKLQKNIYLGKSHSPSQVYRNAVCPQLANELILRYRKKTKQLKLFSLPGGENV